MQLLRAAGNRVRGADPVRVAARAAAPDARGLGPDPGPAGDRAPGRARAQDGPGQDRFAVGAATLSLLATYAEQGPDPVLIDDAQWLDGPSAEAMRFAVRRLVADPIAVLIAVREGEPSLLDGADLPTVRIGGLSREEAASLLGGLAPDATARLHDATAGNPLGLIELGREADELTLAPAGAPVLVSARISREFLRRAGELDEGERRALLLLATSESGDLPLLDRASRRLGVELSALSAAEHAGLVAVRAGSVEFRHPLVRSAIYAGARPEERRAMHRALASALPDRDVDRRAWHLAAAAAGVDERPRPRLSRPGSGRAIEARTLRPRRVRTCRRLASDGERRARLVFAAARQTWHAGSAPRAVALLDEARASTDAPASLLEIDELAGHIATRQGPVMRGHAILTSAAEHADPNRAIAMLAEATGACFYAGNPAEMLVVAEQASGLVAAGAPVRTRFLASIAIGIARVVGGNAADGSEAIHEAVALAGGSPELRDDLQLMPWLAIAPIFLRETGTGRVLLDRALEVARERSAVGALPLVLDLIALDHATTDRWALAEATYQEAIGLARETGQQTDLVFGLSGLARLQARRGRAAECRANVAETVELCDRLGTRLHEVWAVEALGMLELGLGRAESAIEQLTRQQRLVEELGITDADLSPAPELIDAYCRLGHTDKARALANAFGAAAEAKGQSWSIARALRGQGLLASDSRFARAFEQALQRHANTPDVFEQARTQLAYGERLRRARNRKLAREQLRAALETFEHLDARPWIDRARVELAASGETLRRRDPSTIDELTPQELQIAMLLASGKTTREAAAAMFLSPKTIEYHLRHVYLKLDIHSREELARALLGPARPFAHESQDT